MSAYAGKDGVIKVGTNAIGYIDNFSIAVNVTTSETNSLGKDWKEHIEAGRDWSGSLSGTLDYSDAAQKAIIDAVLTHSTTKLTGTFKVNDTLSFSGSFTVTSLSITGSWGDKIAVSFNFTGDGALSKADAHDNA